MAGRACPKGVVLRIIGKRVESASFQRVVLKSSFRAIGVTNFRSSIRQFWHGSGSSSENGSKAQGNE